MFTNTIPVSGKADFSLFAQGIIAKMRAEKNKSQTKTASTKEQTVKTASAEDDEKMAKLRALKDGKKEQTSEEKKEQKTEEKKEEKPQEKKEQKTEEKKEEKPQEKKQQKPQEKKEQKKAQSAKLVKIASLDSKTKSMLKKYWSNIYPKEYVDAMISDE